MSLRATETDLTKQGPASSASYTSNNSNEKSMNLHCPYRQTTLLQQALTPDKGRYGFLLGAGCPVSIRLPMGEGAGKTKPLIPDIAGLTADVQLQLGNDGDYKESLEIITTRLKSSGKTSPNVEDILSHIRALSDIVGKGNVDKLTEKILSGLEKKICLVTTSVVKARLPRDDTPYHHLATWISSINRAHPVELFTTNYDLLMEQALEDRRVPYFDGFVGSNKTFFDVASMEQEILPARWARLWKVHGSINWWRKPGSNDGVQRREQGEEDDLQMIHPSHLKYDQSRRMPYLAMLDRFRSFLARPQAVLVTCGYSFADQHINEIIIEGLSGNPTAVCFGLIFGDRASARDAIAKIGKNGNLKLLGADGGVIGTIDRSWHSLHKDDSDLNELAVINKPLPAFRTSATKDQCKFLLGDFVAFGEFLAQQVAQHGEEKGEDHAS